MRAGGLKSAPRTLSKSLDVDGVTARVYREKLPNGARYLSRRLVSSRLNQRQLAKYFPFASCSVILRSFSPSKTRDIHYAVLTRIPTEFHNYCAKSSSLYWTEEFNFKYLIRPCMSRAFARDRVYSIALLNGSNLFTSRAKRLFAKRIRTL